MKRLSAFLFVFCLILLGFGYPRFQLEKKVGRVLADVTVNMRVWGPLITISNVSTSNIVADGADVGWDTEISTPCTLSYGTTVACTDGSANAGTDTSFLVGLSGLNSNTHYFFKIHCETADRYGNAAGTFDTLALPQVIEPVAVPVGGIYPAAQSVSLSSATGGATIYYTTNGSVPTTSSTQYIGPIGIPTSTTLRAIAVRVGMADSSVMTETYTINLPGQVATPSISPAAGTYSSAQSVTLSTITAGATIYYTLDGSLPTIGSTVYVAPIAVASTTTLRAFAIRAGLTDSGVLTAVFTIQPKEEDDNNDQGGHKKSKSASPVTPVRTISNGPEGSVSPPSGGGQAAGPSKRIESPVKEGPTLGQTILMKLANSAVLTFTLSILLLIIAMVLLLVRISILGQLSHAPGMDENLYRWDGIANKLLWLDIIFGFALSILSSVAMMFMLFTLVVSLTFVMLEGVRRYINWRSK
ncbi:hypothetical protein EPO05_04560 [Patescibacteria group bacterium]|nr:MAG: hypothetical protein EPO05_04560 [Patescibacteria group bacterium]